MMKVEYFTTTEFAGLSYENTVRDALEKFLEKRVDIACVTEGTKLEGVVTKYSLYRLLLKNPSLDQPINVAIKQEVITIEREMSLYDAKDIMIDGRVSHAVVLDNGAVYGIMSKSDLIRGIMSEVQNLANRMNSLVENLQDAVISVDENLQITAINQAAKKLLNFNDLTLGKFIHNLLPSFKNDLVHSLTTGVIIEAKKIALPNNNVIASFIPIKQLETISGTMVAFRDITAYESVANELDTTKQLKQILNSALEFAYDGVILTDKFGTITMANEGFLELYKIDSNHQVIGKLITDISPEIPAYKSLKDKQIIKGELLTIHDQSCILTQTPILKDQEVIGGIFKIMFRQLDVWKDLLVKMEQLQSELIYYRGELTRMTCSDNPFGHIVTVNANMKKLLNDAFIAGQSFSTVLITGESGTGKELVADGIHTASGRHGNFIKVNCAAVPGELLESEFFGYADGAFTGSKKGGKPGKFELADQGTLFLDEIGDMSFTLQAKILRVLQEKEFERVGDTKTTHVDVRIVAATNKDLWKLVEEEKFREDLYYRIHVIHLHIPPLRERINDIDVLCNHLIEKISRKTKKTIRGISPTVINFFKSYEWKGNVRQLENVMERAFHFCEGEIIEVIHLPESMITTSIEDQSSLNTKPLPSSRRYEQILELDRTIIIDALKKASGNKTKAANLLNISRSTLYQKIKQHKIKEVSSFTLS